MDSKGVKGVQGESKGFKDISSVSKMIQKVINFASNMVQNRSKHFRLNGIFSRSKLELSLRLVYEKISYI